MRFTARNRYHIHNLQRTRKLLFRILAVATTLVPSNSNAAIFSVTNTNDSAAGSLRAAVNNANNAPGIDTILFSSLTGQTITLTSGEITINDDLIISGPITGNASSIIIDGNHSSRIFNIPDGNVTLENLTLNKGLVVDGNGGAVNSYGSILILNNSIVSGNSVNAINENVHGGGLAGSRITLNHSIVSGNSARGRFSEGGGLAGSNITLNQSTVYGNTADYNGGGIDASRITLSQSTISGNTAGRTGGGMSAPVCGSSINQSTITLNIANGVAGAGGVNLFMAAIFTQPFICETTNIDNTILAGNSGLSGNIDMVFAINVNNSIFGDPANEINGANTGNVFSDDPDLGLLQLNGGSVPTHLPNPFSPAIDAGDNTLAPDTVDQRGTGFSRIINGVVDIGAVERQPASPIPVFTLPGFIALMTGLTMLVGWRQSR